MRLVRSFLCKKLTSLSICGPAAASKVFHLPDATNSHASVTCPMGPLLAWASFRDDPQDTNADDATNGDGNDEDDDGSGSDTVDSDGVIITAVNVKLTVVQPAHLLYRNRCAPDDTDHAMHGMTYFVLLRTFRVERYKPPTSASTPGNDDDDDNDDSDAESEPSGAPRKRGRFA